MTTPIRYVNETLDPRTVFTATTGQTVFNVTEFGIRTAAELGLLVDGSAPVGSYTVTGLDDSDGFTVTFDDPMAGGEQVVAYLDMALERTSVYGEEKSWTPAAVNAEFADLTRILQQISGETVRSVRVSVDDESSVTLPSVADRKGKLLAFDATTGEPIASTGEAVNGIVFSTIGEDIATAADAAAVLTLTGAIDGSSLNASNLDTGTVPTARLPTIPAGNLPAASTTAIGAVELATTAEALAGTPAGKVPDVVEMAAAIANVLAFSTAQTTEDVSGSRTHSTSYQNTDATARIVMLVVQNVPAGRILQVHSADGDWGNSREIPLGEATFLQFYCLVVPPNWYYRINASLTVTAWLEFTL